MLNVWCFTMDLDRLFQPRSIAVIGASATQGSVGHTYLKSLLDSQYDGRVYPVNPKYDEIMGVRCYSSIEEAGTADLAVIATNRRLALDLLKECSAAGVKSVIIPTGGYEEVGEEGARLEQEIRRVAVEGDMALLGTNTLGLINNLIDLQINFNPRKLPPPGGVSIVSQSGGMGLSIISKLREEGVGMNKWIGVGNRTQLDFPEILEYLKSDPSTEAIGLFIEGTERAGDLCRVAREIVPHKPIVAYKIGKSETVEFMAVTHTGTGVGNSDVYRGAFRQSGILPVDSTRELVAKLKALTQAPLPSGKTLGMFTYTAGPSIAAVDMIAPYFDIQQPDEKRIEEIKEEMKGEPPALLKNPLDVNGEGYSPDSYRRLLSVFARGPAYHILATVSTAGLLFPVQELLEVQEEVGVALVHCHIADSLEIDGSARADLQARKIPVYTTAEEMAFGLIALSEYMDARERVAPREDRETILLDASHIEGEIMDEFESKSLLSMADLPVIEEERVSDYPRLKETADEMDYPLVLKIVSREILHKSEVGGVITDIVDEKMLRTAFETLKEKWPDENVIVQPMVEEGVELIIGRKKDKIFGDILTLGVGGYLADLFPPVVRACPCDCTTCLDMIDSLEPQAILDGYRGMETVDGKALAQLMERVSRLRLGGESILEMDLNPVIVQGSDLFIVDALVRKTVSR